MLASALAAMLVQSSVPLGFALAGDASRWSPLNRAPVLQFLLVAAAFAR